MSERGARRAVGALAALSLIFGAGCYSYVPANLGVVPIGEGVRVYLSQSGVERLREIGGEALPGVVDRPVLVGRLVSRDATAFSLQVPVGTRQVGFHSAELDQQVTLPMADVVQVEHRRVSGTRTALLTGAGTAFLATAMVLILSDARSPVDNPGGDGDNLRIPLGSIPAF